jgi:transcription initiation factor TFIIIB Brf1 subunit/transcription initiation factor TFIIB
MRLSQIKNKILKEAGLSDLLQTVLSPKTDKNEKPSEFKSFINKFVDKLSTSLNLAIEQGRVDPRKSTKQAYSSELSKGRIAQTKNTQNLNTYIKQMSSQFSAATDNNQKRMIARELLDYMADRKDYPEWQNAVGTAIQIVKRSGMDKDGINQTIEKLRQGKPAVVIPETFEYDSTNLILENLINEAQTISVSDYVKKFISNYYAMAKSSEDKIYLDKLTANIDKEYASSLGVSNEKTSQAIASLAKSLYAMSTSSSKSTEPAQKVSNRTKQSSKRAKVTVKSPNTDEEEFYINKVKLDPNNPNDAATINAIKRQRATR